MNLQAAADGYGLPQQQAGSCIMLPMAPIAGGQLHDAAGVSTGREVRRVGPALARLPYSREVWRVRIVVVGWGWVCLSTRTRVHVILCSLITK